MSSNGSQMGAKCTPLFLTRTLRRPPIDDKTIFDEALQSSLKLVVPFFTPVCVGFLLVLMNSSEDPCMNFASSIGRADLDMPLVTAVPNVVDDAVATKKLSTRV
ncbi:uncharacterized protein LOC111385386 [Olea europaea var. sylvestris]|uniref:uncharacterized protein LOC111385386 n=1 Tax=Olea europaea var. sylvestris TaxID=158386 RepID=UPI000C1CEAE5|nr:uncharacterized protein LOC111385386 [Olea europaea var. sylvestris]